MQDIKVVFKPTKCDNDYEKSARYRSIVSNNGMTDVFVAVSVTTNKKVFEVKHTRLKGGNSTVVCYYYIGDTRIRIGAANSAYEIDAFLDAIKQLGFEVPDYQFRNFTHDVCKILSGMGVVIKKGLFVYHVNKG